MFFFWHASALSGTHSVWIRSGVSPAAGWHFFVFCLKNQQFGSWQPFIHLLSGLIVFDSVLISFQQIWQHFVFFFLIIFTFSFFCCMPAPCQGHTWFGLDPVCPWQQADTFLFYIITCWEKLHSISIQFWIYVWFLYILVCQPAVRDTISLN